MINVKRLEKYGFFKMNTNEQIEFLRKHHFYELSNENKIKFLEQIGLFYIDINDDPPNIPLKPEDIDYLRNIPENAQKNKIIKIWKESFINNAIKRKIFKINQVNGSNVLENLNTGGIITMNHFNPMDMFAVERTLKQIGVNKKVYKVIREGNYTNFPGWIGLYFRNDNTLPLSQVPETMEMFYEAIETILKNGDLIIVCPEQSMWLNYRKPRPLRYGAFKFAVSNNVPIIPIFITMDDSAHEYNINIGNLILKDDNLTLKQNIKKMRDMNYEFCVNAYKNFYSEDVKYITLPHEYLPEYVSSTQYFREIAKENQESER